jgi:hypothetical protein
VIGGVLLVLALAVVAGFVGNRIRASNPVSPIFPATVSNDTARAVYVLECDTDCTSFQWGELLDPQEATGVVASSVNEPQWYLVVDEGGATIGCLDLQYDHEIANLTVGVSRAGTCPPGTPSAITTPQRQA